MLHPFYCPRCSYEVSIGDFDETVICGHCGEMFHPEQAREMPPLLAARLRYEYDHPKPESLRKAEKMVVRGLVAYGFGQQSQVTRDDGFEIAVDDILIIVKHVKE